MHHIKYLSILLLAFSNFQLAYGQDMPKYFASINKADSLSSIGKLKEGNKEYKIALKISGGDPHAWLSAAQVNLKLGKLNKVEKMIENAIKNGADLHAIMSRKDLYLYYNSNPQLKSQYRKSRNAYHSNIKYKDEVISLLSMVQSDQTLRSLLREVDFKKIDSLIHINDTTNMTALRTIIADIGFPDRKKIGQDGINAVFIILMHTLNDGVNDKENIAEIKPMLVKAVKEGNFPPFYLAILIDRNKGISNLPQTYGTYWEIDRGTGNKVITPIDDLINVDKRRKEIGLTSLAYDAVQQKLILPKGYPTK